MSEADDDVPEEVIVTVTDFVEGVLTGAERDEVAKKIESDPIWKQTHDEMVEARKHISGMRKAKAPDGFTQDVTETIHKRSAGRFFARRTLGDRVPFGVLLIVAILALGVVGYLMWSSPTGSLKVDKQKDPTTPPPVPIPKP
jgi:hypothetical protein